MKKVLLFFLVCCLVVNSMLVSVLAAPADIEFSMSEVKAMIAELGEKLDVADADDRAASFLLAKTYLSTDEGVDTLIEIIENDEFTTNPVVSDIYTVIGDVTDRKEQFVFILKFMKCFDPEDRVEVMDRFYARDSIDFTVAERSDIRDIYLYFNPEATIDILDEENAVRGEMIASLFTIFDGKLMLTDSSAGAVDFKLKSISTAFKNKLDALLGEYTFSDEDYSSKAFINMIIEGVNEDFPRSTKLKIKNVFETVGIYEPVEESKNSSSSSSSSSGITGGVAGDVPSYGNLTPGTIVSPAEFIAQHTVAGTEIAGFDDTVGHWCHNYTTILKHVGILAGDAGTNNYRPDWKINREEMAVLMMRILALRDGVDAADATHITYLDEADISPWAVNSISYLTPLGILKGYPDGNYMPKKEITREEAVAIISRVLDYKYKVKTAVAHYADQEHIGDWAENDILYTSGLGIVNGYSTGEFLPKNYITRAEVATLIYNMMSVEGLLK